MKLCGEWDVQNGISSDHVSQFRFHTGDQLYRQEASKKESLVSILKGPTCG